MGLAIPWPAMSGAEPCTGSYRPSVPGPRLAEGSIPMEPVIIAASSREDVAEQVLGDDHVEVGRAADQLHGGVVDEHVLQLDVRVRRGGLDDLLAPQARGLEHVGLVHRGHLAAAAGGGPEAPLGQPRDLRLGVDAGVEGALGLAAALAEVEPAGELAHHQQVGALDALAAQGARVVERRPGAHRAQVGVQAEAGRAGPAAPARGAACRGRWCPTWGRPPRRAAPRPRPRQASSTSSVSAVPWASIEMPPIRCSCQPIVSSWSGAIASTTRRASATTSGPIPSPGSSATDTSGTRTPSLDDEPGEAIRGTLSEFRGF